MNATVSISLKGAVIKIALLKGNIISKPVLIKKRMYRIILLLGVTQPRGSNLVNLLALFVHMINTLAYI